MKVPDAYTHSTASRKLQYNHKHGLPLNIAFLDIDSTMTTPGNSETTNIVRALLEERGYVVAFVTSKTEELIISEKERTRSPFYSRPLPHLGKDGSGRRYYVDPTDTEPAGTLDADIIIGTSGTTLSLKQVKGGYLPDRHFYSLLPSSSKGWREQVISLVKKINKVKNVAEIHPNEYIENYENGVTDIAPPDLRVELLFTSEANKKYFVSALNTQKAGSTISVQLTDDSNPTHEKYTVLITPSKITKATSVQYVVETLCNRVSKVPEKLHLFLAGDSFTDLGMGVFGGEKTNATFLIVGGSRLSSHLTDKGLTEFAGESLKDLKSNLKAHPTQAGKLIFNHNSSKRTIVIADKVFPNTKGPESILAYFKQAAI